MFFPKRYILLFLIGSFLIQGCSYFSNKAFYESLQKRECNQSTDYRLNKESCDATNSNLRSYEEYENARKEKSEE